MAAFCGVPYDEWRSGLIATFVAPYATGHDVVELAPGHGRWSAPLIDMARSVALVDLSRECIAVCRARLLSGPA